jgi:Brain and reproductive organ-expressed protein (BRE)
MANHAAPHLIMGLKEEEYHVYDFCKSTQLEIFDRFSVDVPYSKSIIKIRVMLNALAPQHSPDIIILHPSFDIILDYTFLFRDWNPSDRKALLIVFDRVRTSFASYYLEIFNILKTEQLNFIYNSSQSLLENKSMELLLTYDDQEIKETVFSLPVPVFLAHESCTKSVTCHVTLVKNCERFAIEIVYPNWATHLHQFNISKLSNSNSWPVSRFFDVMKQVYSYLKKEINAVINSKDQRAIFFTSLNNVGMGVPLEVDTVDFFKASFHMEIYHGSFLECINIIILLEKDFPKSSPVYKLRSMKNIRNGELREKKYPKVKGWDSDSEIQVLAEFFKKTINEDLKNFFNWINS